MRIPCPSLFRLIAFALTTATLLFFFVSTTPPLADAGDDNTADFSPKYVEILDGQSENVTVHVSYTLTDDDVTARTIDVYLVDQGSDMNIEQEVKEITQGLGEGVAFEFDMTFTLKCVNGSVENAGGGEITILISIGDTEIDGDADLATVKCKSDIAVIFEPEELDIFDGQKEFVAVHITKMTTAAERQLGTINVDLVDDDAPFGDTKLGENDVKHSATNQKPIVKFSTKFVLKCVDLEVHGGKFGDSNEQEAELAIEIDTGPTNHGMGIARCIERETSFFNSTGSMPSDVAVDEEDQLAYFLNAGGPNVDVYTTAGAFVDTITLPCPEEPAGLAGAQPAAGNPCVWQGLEFLRLFNAPYLLASDYANALIYFFPILLFLGAGADDAAALPAGDEIVSVPVGAGPEGIAYDPATNQIYVASSIQGRVYVIDAETMTEVAQVIFTGQASDIAIDSDAGRVYVTSFNGDVVIVIDTATNDSLGNISVGDGPLGIDLDPETGDIWVANYREDSVSVIDGESVGSAQPVVDTFTVGNAPIALAVNPLTDRVFVGNAVDDNVSIVDRETHEVVATVDVGDTPDAVEVSPAAGFVYVANHGDDTYTFISDPAPEATGVPLLWADDDCNASVAATDALKKLQDIASLPYNVEPGCPALGDFVAAAPAGFGQLIWGDTDCDGDYDAVDALQILRFIAAFSVNQTQPCPAIGDVLLVE